MNHLSDVSSSENSSEYVLDSSLLKFDYRDQPGHIKPKCQIEVKILQ